MSEPCPRCPCPDTCRRVPAYCRWAATDPPDPIEIRHICQASSRAPRSDPAPAPRAAAGDRPTAAEALDLTRRANACPYRSRDAACGCSGARCALRGGSIVSHLDCFKCLRRYPG